MPCVPMIEMISATLCWEPTTTILGDPVPIVHGESRDQEVSSDEEVSSGEETIIENSHQRPPLVGYNSLDFPERLAN